MNYILFMDEAQFDCDWSHNNPHEVVQSNIQHKFSVIIWCQIMGSHPCGLHVIEGYYLEN
jgi:hypothetical protein